MFFSKIDGELSIFKENQVFLFGASSAGLRVKRILENFGISIVAFLDNNIKKQGKQIEGVDIISMPALHDMLVKCEKYIIQIASVYEEEIAGQLKEEKLVYISYSEFSTRIHMLSEYLFFAENKDLCSHMYESEWKRESADIELLMRKYFMNKKLVYGKVDTINFMLSAPKTGNNTILDSLQSDELMLATHSYTLIKEFLDRYSAKFKMNIIIGVRDVVSQNLSFLFEAMDDGYLNGIDLVWKNDVQEVFNHCILLNEDGSLLQYIRGKLGTNYLVQDFFDQQLKTYFKIDIYQYPFDKKRGYSIYEFGDVRIMIYQLEKLNLLEYEVGKFLDIDDFKLKSANVSTDKWYFEYYKNVCKEIVLEQEYFERCYSGKYMNHFYSDEDIMTFKEKWKNIH